MPRLSQPEHIRTLLGIDRGWAAYALADLAPGFFEHCEWHGCDTPAPAILLLYRAFNPPVLVTVGPASAMVNLLEEIHTEPEMCLSVQPDILPLIQARYEIMGETPMWRMVLAPAAFNAPAASTAVRLTPADLPALEQLYADGHANGEAPDAFSPEMVEKGIFFGVREGHALVAAAGTHLYTQAESIGTVGNVYTRRDRRGQGLARQVTGGVTRELLLLGLQTIVLSVAQCNAAAIRVYERLGYQRHTSFYEGLARQRRPITS